MKMTAKKTAIVAGAGVVAATLAVAAFLPYGQQTSFDTVATAASIDATALTAEKQTTPQLAAMTTSTSPLPETQLSVPVDEAQITENTMVEPAPVEMSEIDTEDEGLGGDELVVVDSSIDMSDAAEIVSAPVYDEFIAEPEQTETIVETTPTEIEYINGVPKIDFEAAIAETPAGAILVDCTYDPETKTVFRTYDGNDAQEGFEPGRGYWAIGTSQLVQAVPSLL